MKMNFIKFENVNMLLFFKDEKYYNIFDFSDCFHGID